MITVVLDDDPTGTQGVADVPVVLDWSSARAWDGVLADDPAVHVLTNSRAHDAPEAAQLVGSAAAAARERFPDARFVLRGDSTLRAHLWEEYNALRSAVAPNENAIPLLLVPALPAAGRVTIGGIHLQERDGERVPLHRTEYARDAGFAYSSAVLSQWASERSGGRFSADDAVTVALGRLRSSEGADAVAEALGAAAAVGRPAVVIPDAETEDDLLVIAEGLVGAEALGTSVFVRCAPAFVATLTGTRSSTLSPVPSGHAGVLVLCGSFVATSTAQIEQLGRLYPGVLTARVAELVGEHWEAEVERLSQEAQARLERDGLAVIATERTRDPALFDTLSQRRIATRFAQIARRVPVGVVIAKGGITSAVTARDGLDADAARVVGPIYPGVALWRLPNGRAFAIVPGNVGHPGLLADLVTMITVATARAEARAC